MSFRVWLALLMAVLLVGCSAAEPSPSTKMVGPFSVTEYISPVKTPDAKANRSEALAQARAAAASAPGAAVSDDRVEKANATLARFGYTVKKASDGHLELYQGERMIKGGFSYVRQPSVSRSGKDFVMAIGKGPADEWWLLRPSGLQTWDFHRAMWVPPVFAGTRLVSVGVIDPQVVVVAVDGKEVYRKEITGSPTQYPVKRLDTWDGQWVLELLGEIVVEGKPLRYAESFGYHHVGGKPFHFIREDGLYKIVYDGKVWPLGYTDIVYNACCEPAQYNPGLFDDGARFYAYRDKAWRFVMLQVKP